MRQLVAQVTTLIVMATASVRGQDLSARLDSVMRVAERDGFSGVVRIERAGVTVLEQGYGLANRAEKIPFTPATVVQIGSNTKDFTTVAILQLVQAGRLHLADSIGRYFPSAPAAKRAITIAQLMNHRAGFPLGIGGDFDALSRRQFVDTAMRTTLLFAPGARESYSNTGYSLLTAIIEQVTGTTYDAYVRDAILAPLGLTRTGLLLPGFKPVELAHGYLATGADHGTFLEKPHAADGPYWNLRGNGGMLSTAGEMHAFYAALFGSDKLLRPATRALQFNPEEPIGLAGSDGVNFFLYERLPRMRTEIIIASTNAALQAPMVRRELGKVLNLPDPDGGGGGGDDAVAAKPGAKPAPAAVADVIRALVAVVNANDGAALRRFIAEHFASGAGEPTVEERADRIGGLHARLGILTVEHVDTFDDGSVEATLKSTLLGKVILLPSMDRSAPYRVHGVRVRVGG